jgi:hypothetical protein
LKSVFYKKENKNGDKDRNKKQNRKEKKKRNKIEEKMSVPCFVKGCQEAETFGGFCLKHLIETYDIGRWIMFVENIVKPHNLDIPTILMETARDKIGKLSEMMNEEVIEMENEDIPKMTNENVPEMMSEEVEDPEHNDPLLCAEDEYQYDLEMLDLLISFDKN